MLFSLNTAYVMAHFDFKIVWRPLSQIRSERYGRFATLREGRYGNVREVD